MATLSRNVRFSVTLRCDKDGLEEHLGVFLKGICAKSWKAVGRKCAPAFGE